MLWLYSCDIKSNFHIEILASTYSCTIGNSIRVTIISNKKFSILGYSFTFHQENYFSLFQRKFFLCVTTSPLLNPRKFRSCCFEQQFTSQYSVRSNWRSLLKVITFESDWWNKYIYDDVWKWFVEVIINFFTYNPDIFLVITISVFEGSR